MLKIIKRFGTFLLASTFCTQTLGFAIAASKPSVEDNLYKNVNYDWISKTAVPAGKSYYDDDIAMNSFITVLESYSKNISSLNPSSDMYNAANVYLSLKNYGSRNSLGVAPLSAYLQKIDKISSMDDFARICGELTNSGFDIVNMNYVTSPANAGIIRLVDFELEYYYPENYGPNYTSYLKTLFSYINEGAASNEVVNFEKLLAKYSEDYHYNDLKGSEFQSLLSANKQNNLSETFKNIFAQQLGLTSTQNIQIEDDIIAQLQIIGGQSNNIPLLKNFLKSKILRYSAGLLTKNIETVWANNKGYASLTDNNRYTKILLNSLGFDRLYGKALTDNISSKDKSFVQSIFDRVKRQYVTDLNNMNLESKNKLINYINDIKISFGVPIDLQQGIPFPAMSNSSPLENMLKLNAYNTKVCIKKANTSHGFNYSQEKTFVKANVDPNMAYEYSSHSVIFCPLIFNSSRYNDSISDQEKWLAMAFTIGHEMGHSLDSQRVPNLANRFSLSQNDVNVLSKTFRPVSSQIQSYNININGKSYTMNPTRVLFEAIADLYGSETVVKIIKQDKNATLDEFFKVYSKMRRSVETDEKLKTIIEREFHPINEYRVNKTLSNLQELYQTYNIGSNNGMFTSPEKRTSLNN